MRHAAPLTLGERIASAHVGAIYGQLTILALAGRDRNGARVRCVCACGAETLARFVDVRRGAAQTCGCGQRRPSHGHRTVAVTTPTYRSWRAMWQRCTNPKARGWKNWGGKGVTICDRWKDFRLFLEDMGPRPKGTSIHRVSPFGNYELGNCVWATAQEQAANKRRHHVR